MKKAQNDYIHKLEKELLRSLVDPQDSAQRKRYVKRWIYGELTPSPATKEAISEAGSETQSIWSLLHKVITGDE